MKLTSAYLGHHGLVAGIYDELGIGNIIDKILPKQGQHKLSHSVIVKAMLINTLGFNERRLYIFPEFFKNPDTERLLGAGVVPDDINDDVLGRPLRSVRVQFSYKRDSQKTTLPSEAPTRWPSDPIKGGEHHQRIFSSISYPHETAKSQTKDRY